MELPRPCLRLADAQPLSPSQGHSRPVPEGFPLSLPGPASECRGWGRTGLLALVAVPSGGSPLQACSLAGAGPGRLRSQLAVGTRDPEAQLPVLSRGFCSGACLGFLCREAVGLGASGTRSGRWLGPLGSLPTVSAWSPRGKGEARMTGTYAVVTTQATTGPGRAAPGVTWLARSSRRLPTLSLQKGRLLQPARR